jgi:hypothetical protein
MFCITFEGYFSVITCLIVYLLLILASSVVEILPALRGTFLPWKKPCQRCGEHFFRGRNSADVVGNISSMEETVPMLSGVFLP